MVCKFFFKKHGTLGGETSFQTLALDATDPDFIPNTTYDTLNTTKNNQIPKNRIKSKL